jgi:uncharacterized membrane protein
MITDQAYVVVLAVICIGFAFVLLGFAMAFWRPEREATPLLLILAGILLIVSAAQVVTG